MLRSDLRFALLLAGLVFVAVLGYRIRAELLSTLRAADTLWLSFSVLSFFLSSLGSVALNRMLFAKHGLNLGWMQVLRLYSYSQVVKYVPGKVWSLFYQTSALGGRTVTGAVVATNVEMAIAGLLSSVGIAIYAGTASSHFLLGSVSFVLSLVCAVGVMRSTLPTRIMRRLRGKVEGELGLDRRTGVIPLALYWMVATVGSAMWVWMLLRALLGPIHAGIWQLLTDFYLASFASAILIVFPGGVGIREGLMVLLNHSGNKLIGVETVTAFAVAARCLQLASESALALTVLVISRFMTAPHHAVRE